MFSGTGHSNMIKLYYVAFTLALVVNLIDAEACGTGLVTEQSTVPNVMSEAL